MAPSHPMEIGNFVLILVGLLLIASGPLILYRTTTSLLSRKRSGEKFTGFGLLSDLLNYVIGVLFFGAGILFVLNNLRGNPFA